MSEVQTNAVICGSRSSACAAAEAPLECCGLLAGPPNLDGDAIVAARYPLANAAASPTEYESESRSLISCRLSNSTFPFPTARVTLTFPFFQ